MTPSPIRKVLSTMRAHQVRCLLMGGQACVLYGAAEFSRDTDLAILADPDNLNRLRAALAGLLAELVAVPRLEQSFLERGHAVHFRCRHPEAEGMRVDLMSVMRGVAPFPELWQRRTTVETLDGDVLELLSLPDLIQAKKTQRDKDWPMIRRLVEASYFAHRAAPTPEQVSFWLRELRTPELLIEIAAVHRGHAEEMTGPRPLLAHALAADPRALEQDLDLEQRAERERDRTYWLPLRQEMENVRRQR